MVLWIVGGVVAAVLLYLGWTYNRLVGLNKRADGAWSDIDVQLKRRWDLVPALVETVKGYARHESGTLENVVEARSQAEQSASVAGRGEAERGLSTAVGTIVPGGSSLGALLVVALVAALLANVVNNLPAILLLLPLLAGHGAGPVLAALVGVNVGPNLTYVGSLATLLWRRIARAHDADPGLAEYHLLGALTVPVSIVVATSALWAGLALTGGG